MVHEEIGEHINESWELSSRETKHGDLHEEEMGEQTNEHILQMCLHFQV